jgi:CubicO group peptidase (beta-lactamase class C family)
MAAAVNDPICAHVMVGHGTGGSDRIPNEMLVDLPSQPAGLPWPTTAWPIGDAPPELEKSVDGLFADTDRWGTTYAVAVVHEARLLLERYGGALEHWDGEAEPVEPTTRLLSWSMAKSVLHAAVGILVGDGRLDLDAPAPVPAWADDDRSAITLDHLLAMRDGLDFAEDYEDFEGSDVIAMLFGDGQHDVAAYAEDRPLAHPPGEVFNYSSGTSNIVSAIVGRTVGKGQDTVEFLRDRLFEPIGMTSAEPRLDGAGTFVGSSYLYATARDYARFGLLYLRDGVWDGRRLLPEGWVDLARTYRSTDPVDGRAYGSHWWLERDDPLGAFRASGYDGQSILCVPALDLIVVRLGKSPGEQSDRLAEWRTEVVELFTP